MIILIALYLAFRVVNDVVKKKVSNSFSGNGVSGSLFFVLETSIFAMLVFFVLNGFKLYVNPRVAFYGFLYGVIVIVAVASGVFVYNYATIAFVGFASSGVNLLLSLLLGVVLFSEKVGFGTVFRIVLMLLAALVSFIGAGGFGKGDSVKALRGNKFLVGIFFTVIIGVTTSLANVLMKYYGTDPGVTDSNSFFFMTNVFSGLLVIPMIPFAAKRDGVKFSELVDYVKGKKALYAMLTTASSNLCSVFSILILAMIDVSVFTPLQGALGFVSIAIATPIIREKLDKYTLIATALAIASVAVPELIALI